MKLSKAKIVVFATAGVTVALLAAILFPYIRYIDRDQAMHNAITRDDKITVARLLDGGLDTLTQSNALVYACTETRVEIVRMMLEHGVDPNNRDYEGKLPLSWAIIFATGTSEKRYLPVIKLLLEHGAQINTGVPGFLPPLSEAAGYDEREVIKLLLQHGADVNYHNSRHSTALYEAQKYANAPTTTVLLAAGADPFIPGLDGKLPIDKARFINRVVTVGLLKEAMAKWKPKATNGHQK
ncbi:MAG: ankyrin repeat domain-containing protein [Chthonomonadales bacterium]